MMGGATNWRIAQTADDYLRTQEKRLAREERRASPTSAADLLGPGMSARAVQIMDWNAEECQFNGFFYSAPGAFNTPDSTAAWTGNVIGHEDGSGMQQVWDPENPVSARYFMRTYEPNALDDGNVIFTAWKRFATPTGNVDATVIDPPIMEDIETAKENAQQALDDAAAALGFAEGAASVYRQDAAPTGTLNVNDIWFDTNDANRVYTYDGTAWVDATAGWLVTNPTAAFPGIVISPTGLAAYDAAGVATFTVASATGAVVMKGALTSGSTINGAIVTGGTFQTEATVNRGLKINSSGLAAYNALGSAVLVFDSASGSLSLSGDITSGSTITGATFQTEVTPLRGLKINTSGIKSYNTSGLEVFSLSPYGDVVMSGSSVVNRTLYVNSIEVQDKGYGDAPGITVVNGGVFVQGGNLSCANAALMDTIQGRTGTTVTVNAQLDVASGHVINAPSGLVTNFFSAFKSGFKTSANLATGGTDSIPVVFSTAFATRPVVTVTPSDVSSAANVQWSVSALSASGFTIQVKRLGSSGTIELAWMASTAA